MLPFIREAVTLWHEASLGSELFRKSSDADAARKAMDEFLRQGLLFGDGKATERERFSIFASELAYRLQGVGNRSLTSLLNRIYNKIQGIAEHSIFDNGDETKYSVEDAIKIVFKIPDSKINENGKDGRNVGSHVAVPDRTGTGGRQGSTTGTGIGEPEPKGKGTSDSTGGTDRNTEKGGGDNEEPQQEVAAGEKKKDAAAISPTSENGAGRETVADAGKQKKEESLKTAQEEFGEDVKESSHEIELVPESLDDGEAELTIGIKVDGKESDLQFFSYEGRNTDEHEQGVMYTDNALTYDEAQVLSDEYNQFRKKNVCSPDSDALRINFNKVDDAIDFEAWKKKRDKKDAIWKKALESLEYYKRNGIEPAKLPKGEKWNTDDVIVTKDRPDYTAKVKVVGKDLYVKGIELAGTNVKDGGVVVIRNFRNIPYNKLWLIPMNDKYDSSPFPRIVCDAIMKMYVRENVDLGLVESGLHSIRRPVQKQIGTTADDLSNDTEAKRAATGGILQMLKNNGVKVHIVNDIEEVPDEADRQEYVKKINDKFNEELNKYSNGSLKGKLSLGLPSEIIKTTLSIPESEIEITQSTLSKHLKKHNLNIDDIKNLVDAVQKPMMVYTWGEKAKSGIIITNITKDDGRRITVALKLERNGEKLDINEIASIHGKDLERLVKEMNTTKTEFGKDNLKWVDKEKALEWLSVDSPKESSTTIQELSSAAKVVKDFNNPSILDKKIQKQLVFHGSGNYFDDFDFSHMSEGEGAQAYGWGGYVTQVKEIGKTYAKSVNGIPIYGIRNNGYWNKLSPNNPEYDLVKSAYEIMEWKGLSDARKFTKEWSEKADTKEARDKWKGIYTILNNHVAADFKITSSHILYTIDIPDNDGKNYLSYTEQIGDSKVGLIGSNLEKLGFKKTDSDIPTYEKGDKKVVLNPKAQGQDIYAELSEAFGSDKEASRVLNEAGFVGIEYPAEYRSGGRHDNAKNYVIFNEKDMKITDHVRFLKDSKGTVYGYTVGGEIYLSQKGLNPNTPIHEYTHIWAGVMKNKNSKEWKHIKSLLKGTPVWEEVLNDNGYSEIKVNEDEVASEVLSRISGRKNSQLIIDSMQKGIDEAKAKGDVFGTAQQVSALYKLKTALNDFWKWVGKDLFHVHFKNIDEITDRVLYDMANGTELKVTGEKDNMRRNQFIGEKGAGNADKSEEATTRIDNLRVAREMETAKKDAKNIKMATGWERGADGKWRYETADIDLKTFRDRNKIKYDVAYIKYKIHENVEKMKVNGEFPKELSEDGKWEEAIESIIRKNGDVSFFYNHLPIKDKDEVISGAQDNVSEDDLNYIIQQGNEFKISDLGKNGEKLLQIYPLLQRIDIVVERMAPDMFGEFNPNKERISINRNLSENDMQSILSHEIQHAIQYTEGFAEGGNAESIKVRLLKEAQTYSGEDRKIAEDGAEEESYDEYHRLGGEVEARNVQSRMDMTLEERRNSLASETEDVSREDQIFLYNGLKSDMGSRVKQRMNDIVEKLKEKELTEEQQAVADVFSGKRDNTRLDVERNDGKHSIVMRQGNEDKAGAKHSLFRHYGTDSGTITADDVIKIPEVIKNGEKTVKNNGMTEYKHTIDGITYKVITEKHRGKESFADFYSNKKTSKSSPFNTQSSAQFLNNDALSADKGTNKKENIQSVGEKKQDGLRFRFSNTSEDFKNIQKRAVEEKGIVMPGLKTAEVKVVDVPKHDFTGDKPISQARSWAKENIVGEHSMYNGDKYNISNNAIDKYLSSSATGENKSDNLGVHLAVLKSLHKVIDESIDAEIHPDYSKVDGTRSAENEVGNKELLVHRMYGAVNIDGTLYRVKTTMHEYLPNSGNINSPHSYEVTKIELLENQTALGARSLNPKKEDISLGTANLLKGVEKSYDKGKYLLDESEDLTNGEANSNLEIATDGIQSSPISHAIVLGKRMNTEIHVVHDSDFAAGDERIGKKGRKQRVARS